MYNFVRNIKANCSKAKRNAPQKLNKIFIAMLNKTPKSTLTIENIPKNPGEQKCQLPKSITSMPFETVTV